MYPQTSIYRHVPAPYPCTETLMPKKNRISSPSEAEKEERKEMQISTVCQEPQGFTSVLLLTSSMSFPPLMLVELIIFILHTWKLMLREAKQFPRSHSYQQTQPVYLIISQLFLLCHTASRYDRNYSYPFHKYALIYSDSRH